MTLSREDFIFTIGYEGRTAIVDGKAKREYGKLSTMELAEKGLFRAAFCSALYSGDPQEIQAFIDYYNRVNDVREYTLESCKRLFGVDGIPEGVERVLEVR